MADVKCKGRKLSRMYIHAPPAESYKIQGTTQELDFAVSAQATNIDSKEIWSIYRTLGVRDLAFVEEEYLGELILSITGCQRSDIR